MAKKKSRKPPRNPDAALRRRQNRAPSRVQGLRWDGRKGFYVGVSGELVLDRFGQPL